MEAGGLFPKENWYPTREIVMSLMVLLLLTWTRGEQPLNDHFFKMFCLEKCIYYPCPIWSLLVQCTTWPAHSCNFKKVIKRTRNSWTAQTVQRSPSLYYSRNYVRSKARKIWQSWMMSRIFWSARAVLKLSCSIQLQISLSAWNLS